MRFFHQKPGNEGFLCTQIRHSSIALLVLLLIIGTMPVSASMMFPAQGRTMNAGTGSISFTGLPDIIPAEADIDPMEPGIQVQLTMDVTFSDVGGSASLKLYVNNIPAGHDAFFYDVDNYGEPMTFILTDPGPVTTVVTLEEGINTFAAALRDAGGGAVTWERAGTLVTPTGGSVGELDAELTAELNSLRSRVTGSGMIQEDKDAFGNMLDRLDGALTAARSGEHTDWEALVATNTDVALDLMERVTYFTVTGTAGPGMEPIAGIPDFILQQTMVTIPLEPGMSGMPDNLTLQMPYLEMTVPAVPDAQNPGTQFESLFNFDYNGVSAQVRVLGQVFPGDRTELTVITDNVPSAWQLRTQDPGLWFTADGGLTIRDRIFLDPVVLTITGDFQRFIIKINFYLKLLIPGCPPGGPGFDSTAEGQPGANGDPGDPGPGGLPGDPGNGGAGGRGGTGGDFGMLGAPGVNGAGGLAGLRGDGGDGGDGGDPAPGGPGGNPGVLGPGGPAGANAADNGVWYAHNIYGAPTGKVLTSAAWGEFDAAKSGYELAVAYDNLVWALITSAAVPAVDRLGAFGEDATDATPPTSGYASPELICCPETPSGRSRSPMDTAARSPLNS